MATLNNVMAAIGYLICGYMLIEILWDISYCFMAAISLFLCMLTACCYNKVSPLKKGRFFRGLFALVIHVFRDWWRNIIQGVPYNIGNDYYRWRGIFDWKINKVIKEG